MVQVDVDVELGFDDDVDDAPGRDVRMDVHRVANPEDLVPLGVPRGSCGGWGVPVASGKASIHGK